MTPIIPTASSSTMGAVNSVPSMAQADAAEGVAARGGAEALLPLGGVGAEAETTGAMIAQPPSGRRSVARRRGVVASETSPPSSLNGTRKAGA